MIEETKVIVQNPAFEAKETVQVLSEYTDVIEAELTRIDLSGRQTLETEIGTYVRTLGDLPRIVPQRGDYVLARSEFIEPKWCRALVLDVSFSSIALVEQVDYGYTENVRLAQITELPSVLAMQPAYTVRLKVDRTQFAVGGTYDVYIGSYVDDLYRTVEAFSATEIDSAATEAVPIDGSFVAESATKTGLLEDVDQVENGIVRGTTVNCASIPVYGVQHREGFEAMAVQLAQSELQPKPDTQIGDFVAVPFDSYFCRASVVNLGPESAEVYHVDYGSWDVVKLSSLFWLPEGPPSETPQLSFQCITDDGSVLKENQQYNFEVSSILTDYGYPVRICKASLPGTGSRTVLKVADLAVPSLQTVESVHLIEKSCLNGETYGALIRENDASLSVIEQQLEESFDKPGVDFLNEPHVGDLVISYIEGKFHRSVVCETTDAEICVFQIDVGNFRSCNNSVVMTLPEKLLAFPPLALLCLLDENQSAMEPKTSFQAQNFAHHSTVYGLNVYTFEFASASFDPAPDLGYGTSEEVTSGENYPETEYAVADTTSPADETTPPENVEVHVPDEVIPQEDPGVYFQEEVTHVDNPELYYQAEVTPAETQEVHFQEEVTHVENPEVHYQAEVTPADTQELHYQYVAVPSGDPSVDESFSRLIETRSCATTPTPRESELTPKKLHHRTFPASSLDDLTPSFLDVKIINVSAYSDDLVVLSVALVDRQELLEEALSFIDPDTLKPLYSSDLLSRSPGVMLSGESWVRVVVAERPGPSAYVVQLVDYGMQTSCNVGEVFCCPPEYVPVEMCTLECHLTKSYPGIEACEALIGQVVVLGHTASDSFALYSRETGERITL